MFVRKKQSSRSDNVAIQIVENRREGSKIKQKVLRHVGTAKHEHEVEGLVELAEEIKQRMLHDSSPLFRHIPFEQMKINTHPKKNEDFADVSLKDLEGDDVLNSGIPDVFGQLYDDLGFPKLFRGRSADLHNRILKNCVLARIASPTSKLESTDTLATEFGVRMHVDKIYRMMDELDSNRVRKTIRNATLSILRHQVSIMFYDVTTLYFESFTEDDLRAFGFSKDCKFKETQIVLALVTTTEGLPITYEAFPGNMHEIQTLMPTLKKLQEEFDVKAVEFAADRGMFSEKNLQLLEQAGISYVVGAKLRGMDKATKADILAIHDQQKDGEDTCQQKELEYQGRRLVISYSPARAAKDRKDRKRLLDRLDKMTDDDGKVKAKNLIKNSGSKKYLRFDADRKLARVDEGKIANDAAWDGISGHTTNSKRSADEVIANYSRLWEIEDSFRLCKHDLKMRPIFHRKGSRIRAHLDICFITYALARQLTYRYRLQQGKSVSYANLRKELVRTRFSLLRHVKSGELYGVPTKAHPIVQSLYRLVDLKYSRTPFKI